MRIDHHAVDVENLVILKVFQMSSIVIIEHRQILTGIDYRLNSTLVMNIGRIIEDRSFFKVEFHLFVKLISVKERP